MQGGCQPTQYKSYEQTDFAWFKTVEAGERRFEVKRYSIRVPRGLPPGLNEVLPGFETAEGYFTSEAATRNQEQAAYTQPQCDLASQP
jgi:hypothetical protein